MPGARWTFPLRGAAGDIIWREARRSKKRARTVADAQPQRATHLRGLVASMELAAKVLAGTLKLDLGRVRLRGGGI
jgi:hypothetical protein